MIRGRSSTIHSTRRRNRPPASPPLSTREPPCPRFSGPCPPARGAPARISGARFCHPRRGSSMGSPEDTLRGHAPDERGAGPTPETLPVGPTLPACPALPVGPTLPACPALPNSRRGSTIPSTVAPAVSRHVVVPPCPAEFPSGVGYARRRSRRAARGLVPVCARRCRAPLPARAHGRSLPQRDDGTVAGCVADTGREYGRNRRRRAAPRQQPRANRRRPAAPGQRLCRSPRNQSLPE